MKNNSKNETNNNTQPPHTGQPPQNQHISHHQPHTRTVALFLVQRGDHRDMFHVHFVGTVHQFPVDQQERGSSAQGVQRARFHLLQQLLPLQGNVSEFSKEIRGTFLNFVWWSPG